MALALYVAWVFTMDVLTGALKFSGSLQGSSRTTSVEGQPRTT